MLTSHSYAVVVDRDMLKNANPRVDGDMLTNETSCPNREVSESLDSFSGVPDMFTPNDSFYSKDEGQFWCDTCGHCLSDLVSLTRHVSEHIVINDSHVSHTSHAGQRCKQELITDGDAQKQIGGTRLGMQNHCHTVFAQTQLQAFNC
ncbi:hypothetical protein DPMN_119750 [Dreissena polymorpha]|uniref:C2H2-type domain-containing protein n=1 Tax=Dreissena polymorpha TaxID=45954 RepID=A0A9D4GJ50_DREPO|nr:hypothetical protein DPMN_119750 [Dreissena polymorpha]